MNARIHMQINILPFGNTRYNSEGIVSLPSKPKEIPHYQVPHTTDVDSLEFGVYNDITLVIPEVGEEITPLM
jgi:hypothetical protein